MEFYNKHYIKVDSSGRIIDGFSDAFRQPDEEDICINDKGGYQFRLFPGGEENPNLYHWPHMIPLYKYEDGEIVRRTEEEIKGDIAAIPVPVAPPTTEERLTAIEDALCEMDAANAASIAALEDALCEMDAGGADNE
jgi:hypothetical protein